jgi:ribosomal protein S18 acetylase RimI-like enzyme
LTSSISVRVRDARPDELGAVREITLRAYEEFARVMEPSAWGGLRSAVLGALDTELPAERIVAERDGELLGSVMLFPAATDSYGDPAASAAWPELRLLAVTPEGRGRGVGRALVEECVRRARSAGAAALGLHTSRSMRVAIRLYESLGFRRVPEHDFQPPGAELVTAYALPLDRPAD